MPSVGELWSVKMERDDGAVKEYRGIGDDGGFFFFLLYLFCLCDDFVVYLISLILICLL
jgi:hypothetical protein